MKKSALHIKILFILCFSTFTVTAQEVYDLRNCLETALDNNFNIRIVRNEQKIASNNATAGNAGLLPTLDLSAGYSGTLNNTNQEYTDGKTVNNRNILNQGANLGLNLRWTVFDGFSMQTNYKRLKEFETMGEISTRLSIENLMADLAAEYFNYVRQNIRLSNLKYAVSLSKARLRITEAHYIVGTMAPLDIKLAQVDLNADSSSLIRQYETLYSSNVNLNRFMALDDVSMRIEVADSLINPNPFLQEEFLWTSMLQSNSRLLLSVKNQTISELDYKNLKSRNYPYLRLNTGYGYTVNAYGSGSMKQQDNLSFNYGLSLGFTIFDGFNKQREQRNAQIVIQNRKLQTEQLEQSLKADWVKMWMAYRNNLELINLEKENLATAKDLYEIAIERYKLGQLAGIQLREAQNSLLGAEERLLQAQFNTKLCEISLLQISGQIGLYLE